MFLWLVGFLFLETTSSTMHQKRKKMKMNIAVAKMAKHTAGWSGSPSFFAHHEIREGEREGEGEKEGEVVVSRREKRGG